MQAGDTDSSDPIHADGPLWTLATRHGPAGAPASKSIWGKARAALGDVSTHASKVAALSTTSAAKAADVGKQAAKIAGDVTRGALESSKQVYTGSKLESAVNYIDGELDQPGRKKLLRKRRAKSLVSWTK